VQIIGFDFVQAMSFQINPGLYNANQHGRRFNFLRDSGRSPNKNFGAEKY
jgi:hypothetical protein